MVEDAATGGAAMLFTPEMSGLLDRDRARAAGKIVRRSRRSGAGARCAMRPREAGIWVALGSLAVRRDGRPLGQPLAS